MDEIQQFFRINESLRPDNLDKVFPFTANGDLRSDSGLPWFEVDLVNFPRTEILQEIKACHSELAVHRIHEPHLGWKSFCLHGISTHQTGVAAEYGLDDNDKTIFRWTSVAERCPITVDYFRSQFPADRFERLRVMVVEPGGYILPHQDRTHRALGPLAICLNRPAGCDMVLESHGTVPFREGKGMMVDISYRHAVWNRSSEPRYHLHIEMYGGTKHDEFKKWLNRSFLQRQGSDAN